MKYFFCAALGIVLCSNLFAAEKAIGTGANFKGPLGLQMYSLRFYSPDNLLAKLDKVQEYGLKTIEGGAPAGGMSVEEFLKELDKRGIKMVSTGVNFAQLKSNPDAAVEQAKKLGVKYVMCAWIPHDKEQFSEKHAREAIDVFNMAGPKFKEAGITFTYHCHGYEFQQFGEGTLFDLIVKETKADSVFFELDVFWAQQGGADPAKLLEKHGSRFKLMHVKDLRKGAAKNSTGGAPDEDSVPVGEGEVDWNAVLKAAEAAHVEHYFIEDEAKEAVKQIPKTLRYLESLQLAATPTRSDIPYVANGDERQVLDIYAPPNAKDLPVVFWIHGGGWQAGDKSDVKLKPQWFMDHGFVFVSINYRLLPSVDMGTLHGDVAKSFGWMEKHIAEYGGNPKRALVGGHSAGAQLAAILCTDERYLKAEGVSFDVLLGCIPVDGDTYDIPAMIETAETRLRVHGFGPPKNGHRIKFGNSIESHKDFSAVTHIAKGKGIPPFLILYVNDHPDTSIQAQRLGAVLKEAGVANTLFGAKETNHNKLNDNLGVADDPATGALGEFVGGVMGK